MKLKQKLAISFIRKKLRLLSLISKTKAAHKIFELFCTPFIKSETIPPTIFKSAELINFSFEGKRIQGYQWQKNKPHKVLIIHGFASCAYNFYEYVKDFIEKDFQVLAFDAPAHGLSEGKTINALEYSNLIIEIIKLYGPIDCYLAHSLGGLALCIALENIPHNKSTKVVLIAPATETITAVNDAFKIVQVDDEGVRLAFDKLILQKSGYPISWFSVRRAVKNINASILWIHDENDKVTPLKDALLVKDDHHQNIEFLITKGLGHRKIYRDLSVKKKIEQYL